jgi:urease accessory protein
MSVAAISSSGVSLQRLSAQARLLQFASQALPTGAYAYSAGLESMLNLELLRDEQDCRDYLVTLMESSVAYLELPIFLRMFDAISQGDAATVVRYSQFLFASRETREFQEQEEQMARALCRVLKELRSQDYMQIPSPGTYVEALAWAAHWFGIEREDACVLVVYSWVEQQVSALCRLLPLGPIAGQRLLDGVLRHVPEVIVQAKEVEDSDLGASAPGLAVVSALHETQYCRIFRS